MSIKMEVCTHDLVQLITNTISFLYGLCRRCSG